MRVAENIKEWKEQLDWTRHSGRRLTERQIEKPLGRQYHRVDRQGTG